MIKIRNREFTKYAFWAIAFVFWFITAVSTNGGGAGRDGGDGSIIESFQSNKPVAMPWIPLLLLDDYFNVGPMIMFEPAEPFCSFDNQTCGAEAKIQFQVIGGLPLESLKFKISLDADADGSVDEVLNTGEVLGGTAPDFVVTVTFPIGMHVLLIDVMDGEGNTDSKSIPFEIADCEAPTPVCINGLAVELMPVPPDKDADGDGDIDAGAMTVWAIDILAGQISDCSDPIRYSINRVGEDPDIDQTSLVLTCDDPEKIQVEVYGWDGAINYDFCETYILVQDNMFNLCGS